MRQPEIAQLVHFLSRLGWKLKKVLKMWNEFLRALIGDEKLKRLSLNGMFNFEMASFISS